MADKPGAEGADAVSSLDKAVSRQRGPLPNPDARGKAGPISGARRGKPLRKTDRVKAEEPTPAEEMDDVATKNKADETAEPKAEEAEVKAEVKSELDDGTPTTQLKPMAAPKPAAATATTGTPAKPASIKGGATDKGKAALTAVGSGVSRLRNLIASIVWLAAVLCAALLALGALFTALDQANQSNEIVKWVLDRGHDLVGPFADVFRLETAKNTLLVNWGIAALVYLIAGKVLERVIRP